MSNNVDFGRQGEEIAVEYLLDKGYIILGTNYRSGKNEIDIIAQEGKDIVFVEVKTRATDYFGEPYDAVNKEKQRSIIRAANSYILRNKIMGDARFDIISIVIEFNQENAPKINHIIRAFEPMPF